MRLEYKIIILILLIVAVTGVVTYIDDEPGRVLYYKNPDYNFEVFTTHSWGSVILYWPPENGNITISVKQRHWSPPDSSKPGWGDTTTG